MQPFRSSLTPLIEEEDASCVSISTSPNSFFSRAILYPLGSWEIKFKMRVVLPEPGFVSVGTTYGDIAVN